MKFRASLALATIVAVSLATAGCAQPSSTSDTEGNGDGKLTIAGFASAKPALDPLIKKFEKENKGIDVSVTYADSQQFQATIRTQLAAGTAPDVFTVWPGNGNPGAMEVLVPNGYLKDLSDVKALAGLPKRLDNVTKVDGKRYILPMSIAGMGVIYNEQAVAEAKATIPTTWSEVLEFCDAAKAADKVAFALGIQTLWVTQVITDELVATLVHQKDPDFDKKLADGSTTFAKSKWKDALEKYTEMEKRGCFNANPLGTSADIANGLVATGEALSTATLSNISAAIGALAPAGATFNTFALPATENAEQTWMPAAASDGWGINAKAKNPVAALKFLDFLAGPESMLEYSEVLGSLPSIAPEGFVPDESLSVLSEFWNDGRTFPFMDQMWPNAQVSSAHKEGVQKIFSGQSSIADVLAAMDLAYQKK